jgi:LacI family transcriptional regulator
MATIYEVAALAGVSPATVSRVFNGLTVSAPYAERVRVAAEELQYTPDRTARNLRRGSSQVIALVIPDIENPFFTAMARGVEDRAQKAGLSVILCNTDEEHDKEARYLQVAVSEHMAGVVLAPASEHPDLDSLLARKVPVVAVDRSAHGYDLDTVLVDNQAIARAATEDLYAEGYHVVACITGPATVETAVKRAQGWRKAFVVHTPGVDSEAYLRNSSFRVDGGLEAMTSLLEMPEPPDAVLVANNLMGIGAVHAVVNAEASVGIVVLGDLPFGMSTPPGTRVLPLPARELGLAAADLLLERIGGEAGPGRLVVLADSLSTSSRT